MLQVNFKPNLKPVKMGDPMLSEPALDTLRAQAIKLHRRNRVIMVMGFAFLALILAGIWWWYTQESDLESTILQASGTEAPDTLGDAEALPMPPKEEPHTFKVQVTDDGPLYTQAEEALLQSNWPVAIQKHKALIAIYPHNHALWFNLAVSYHHHGDLTQARYWYEKILLHNSGHRDAKRNLKVLNETNACL
jgi:tetratricopeptide (TPR) repeat protein